LLEDFPAGGGGGPYPRARLVNSVNGTSLDHTLEFLTGQVEGQFTAPCLQLQVTGQKKLIGLIGTGEVSAVLHRFEMNN